MDTGSNWFFRGQGDLNAPPSVWFGADQGVPAFYVIAGSSAASVTQRLRRLVGTAPLPPRWALGHHQCRWGYAGTQDLQALDEAFSAYGFPCDGLWLDIDHMERYEVFTPAPQHFGCVKVEAGYDIAQSGRDAGVDCINPGRPALRGFRLAGPHLVPGLLVAGDSRLPVLTNVQGRPAPPPPPPPPPCAVNRSTDRHRVQRAPVPKLQNRALTAKRQRFLVAWYEACCLFPFLRNPTPPTCRWAASPTSSWSARR